MNAATDSSVSLLFGRGEGVTSIVTDERRAPRVRLVTSGWYRPLTGPRGELLLPDVRRVRVVDLSTSGAFIDSVPYLSLGTWVELYVPLPDAREALVAHGRVVRVDLDREGGYGIRFRPLDTDSEARVRRMLM